MTESTVRDLFRSLEQTIRERCQVIEDVMRHAATGSGTGTAASTAVPVGGVGNLERIIALEQTVMNLAESMKQMMQQQADMMKSLSECKSRKEALVDSIVPKNPLQGIEVIPKKEIVIADVSPIPSSTQPLSMEDRLLLNRKARKALEAEEMGEGLEEHPTIETHTESVVSEESENDIVSAAVVSSLKDEAEEAKVQEAEAEEAEVQEAEAEEAEAEAEAEAEEAEEAEEDGIELEEFEYKGSTYYRDPELNVYMTDENGELVDEPIGIWNDAKQKIMVRKPAAA